MFRVKVRVRVNVWVNSPCDLQMRFGTCDSAGVSWGSKAVLGPGPALGPQNS